MKSKKLEHFVRVRIYEYVELNPGSHLHDNEIYISLAFISLLANFKKKEKVY